MLVLEREMCLSSQAGVVGILAEVVLGLGTAFRARRSTLAGSAFRLGSSNLTRAVSARYSAHSTCTYVAVTLYLCTLYLCTFTEALARCTTPLLSSLLLHYGKRYVLVRGAVHKP